MGYGYYILSDGREAGYAVDAACDHIHCSATVSRGLANLCGDNPIGHKADDEPGCGNYYCDTHSMHHGCTNRVCDTYSDDETLLCGLVAGHSMSHKDFDTGERFIQ